MHLQALEEREPLQPLKSSTL